MECCYPVDCEEYTVTPMLVAPANCPSKCCKDVPVCFPCLPRCTKKVAYCHEKRSPECCESDHCCHHELRSHRMQRSPSPCDHTSHGCKPSCKPVKTKYVVPCYRYEDGRIVTKLPVTAFKRNGMQDQEHSKLLGAANFLSRCPRDVSIECDVCTTPNVRVADPAKVPCIEDTLGCCFRTRKPIEVTLDDILDD